MKKHRKLLSIVVMIGVIFSLRGWMIERHNTPLEEQFALEIQGFESTYGKGEKSQTDERLIRMVDLGQAGSRFLVAGSGYEDWILLDVLITQDRVTQVNLVYSIESDGYGSYVEEDWFLNRTLLSTRTDLELTKYRKEANQEVVAMTGATETSQAVVDAVNVCIKSLRAD